MAAPAREPPAIETFGGGGFRVAGVRHEGSVMILNDTVRPWPATALAVLSAADFAAVLNTQPGEVELVLLGAGLATAIAPKPVREALKTAGVGLDMMSTPEACRMYNYLTGEGRRVAAALLAV